MKVAPQDLSFGVLLKLLPLKTPAPEPGSGSCELVEATRTTGKRSRGVVCSTNKRRHFSSRVAIRNGEPRLFGKSALPPDFDLRDYDRMSKAERREFHESFADMALLFEMMTGRSAPNLDDLIRRERDRLQGGTFDHSSDDVETPATDEAPCPGDRLKELYRALVRRLHPDLNGVHSPRERELWDRLQAAYQAHDLDAMEAVAGRVEAAHRGAASLSIQLLRRMTADLRQALRGLRAQLSRHRKHPAWSFREKSKSLAKFEKHRRSELEWESKQLKAALKSANIELNHLEEKAVQKASKEKEARKLKGEKAAKAKEQNRMKQAGNAEKAAGAFQQESFPF